MKQVQIRYSATPNTKNETKVSIDTDENVIISLDDVKVTFAKGVFSFLFEQTVELSDDELTKLSDDSVLKEADDIRLKLTSDLRNKASAIIKRLAYYYSIPDVLDSFTAQGFVEWSLDGNEWKQIYNRYEAKWVIAEGGQYYLPKNLPSWYDKLINIEPLMAFEFLHKAFNEDNHKVSWILATVSAELAFKEFVSRYDSRLSYLITNMPSPPIEKLYGQILQDLTGQQSSFYKELQKGAATRNALIHNPLTEPKLPFPLKDYLMMVRSAILHLSYLLHNDMEIFKYFYNRSIGELNSSESNKTTYEAIS